MSASRPPHILAIDDEPDLRPLFADILEAEGYVVTLAGRPLPIAEIVRARPDLILLDLVIDRSPIGWAYLDELAVEQRTRDIPVVICSAAASEVGEHVDTLRRLGVDVVLKPFDLEVLLDAISRRLSVAADAGASPRRRSSLGAD